MVTKYLRRALNLMDRPNKFVLQTHDPKLQLDASIPVVLVKRSDLFAQTLSGVIADHYGEWTKYTNKDGTFIADPEIFENKYVWNLRWFDAFDHFTRYDSKFEIWFEEFIIDPTIINKTIGLPDLAIEIETEKSPYGADRIENLSEIKELFRRLENDENSHDFPIESRPWDFG